MTASFATLAGILGLSLIAYIGGRYLARRKFLRGRIPLQGSEILRALPAGLDRQAAADVLWNLGRCFNLRTELLRLDDSVLDLNPAVLYHRIHFIHRQCEQFAGNHERKLIDGKHYSELQLDAPFTAEHGRAREVCLLFNRARRNPPPPPDVVDMMLHASLRSVDRYFMQIRRRVSLLERPIATAAAGYRVWHGGAAYNPEIAAKLMDIFRVAYNFSLTGRDRKTPAMRLGWYTKNSHCKTYLMLKARTTGMKSANEIIDILKNGNGIRALGPY